MKKNRVQTLCENVPLNKRYGVSSENVPLSKRYGVSTYIYAAMKVTFK